MRAFSGVLAVMFVAGAQQRVLGSGAQHTLLGGLMKMSGRNLAGIARMGDIGGYGCPIREARGRALCGIRAP